MKTKLIASLGLGLCAVLNPSSQAADNLDRSTLPIPEPTPPKYTELDVRKTKPPAPFEVKAPKGAPNVVIILIDDVPKALDSPGD